MKVFFWIAFAVVIIIAIFAIQNSDAAPVSIKFLFWKFETSLVYTILGSIGAGIFLTLLLWVPMEVRTAFRKSGTSRETVPPPSTR